VVIIRKLKPILYSETVQIPRWTSITLGILIGILTPLIILQYFTATKDPSLIGLYACLDLFFFVIYLNFRKLDIRITTSSLNVAFGLIRKEITVENIVSCEPITTRIGVYTGNGIRIGGDGTLAFITWFGDAVKLKLRSDRPFVFSTNNQDETIKIIHNLIESQPY